MSADPEEEDVLLSEFDSLLDTPLTGLAIEDMVAMDVEADLAEIRQPIPSTPFTTEQIEQLFTNSALLKFESAIFEASGDRTWQLTFQGKKYTVTFFPEVFEVELSVRFMNFGDSLFEDLLQTVSAFVSK